LRAAFGDVNTAAEYLMTGIPEELLNMQNEQAYMQQHQQGSMGEQVNLGGQGNVTSQGNTGGQGGLSMGGSMTLDQMLVTLQQQDPQLAQELNTVLNSTEFGELQRRARQDANILPQILMHLAQYNPRIFEFFNNNKELFVQLMLAAPLGGGAQGQQQGQAGDQPQQQNPNAIQITPEEKAIIERLMGFGFTQAHVLQAYFACDKNEEMALNYLLDNQEQ